jgi:hypothetical protein|tara:strand:+ start:306 stop:614 length:309 start_codon:yes stop_codon:yes gene_type:complete
MTMVTGYENIKCIRAFTMLNGLRSEIDFNMKLTAKAPSCYTLIKKELGFKGNREKVYNLYKEYLKETYPQVYADYEERINKREARGKRVFTDRKGKQLELPF